jgi:glycosyltransferase involved in cell wall biosynthesis
MKILYAALRYDPRNPDLASGVEYHCYSAFIRAGAEVKVAGPFDPPGTLAERVLRRAYMWTTGKRYLKWNLQLTWNSATTLNRAARQWKPDIVFGFFPPPLAFYDYVAPCVFCTDATFQASEEVYPMYGRLALKFMEWEERRAVQKSARVITFSQWCKNAIVARHGVPEAKVVVQPMPSVLPLEAVPATAAFTPKRIETPVRLLLVGRDYKRKGITTAIEVTKQLNQRGVPAILTIVGLSGEPDGPVRFAGLFRKSVPEELRKYCDFYRQAHLLIHPALFDPSPIVPAEAAAFGVPTISNDVGGISTSVAHGISGIILPKHSPPEAYVEAILGLLKSPDHYTRLSAGARKRYEEEQNWDVAGKRMMAVLEEAVASRGN